MTAVYHAISRTKTWCGLDVGLEGPDPDQGGVAHPMGPIPLIAPSREAVTCEECRAVMPAEQPKHVVASEVVKHRMEKEQVRFDNRDGAAPSLEEEPKLDPMEVAAKVKAKIEKGV